MTPTQTTWLATVFARFAAEPPKGNPSDWVADNIRFDEPECTGPFSFAGREYAREILDAWGDPTITDLVLCFATRGAKTRICMSGLAWKIEHESMRALWVHPSTQGPNGARSVARTRFIPMLKATQCLADRIPGGAERFKFSTAQQMFAGSIVDWAGSHSPGQLGGNPCAVVLQTEVDKFAPATEKEASATHLADQRTKDSPGNIKRVKESTPTLTTGTIWTALLKTDLRRRFLPCPHCEKEVTFVWSKDFTILPDSGCEAEMKWDPAAKRADGKWDLNRVEKTAHMLCPHCAGKITDEHKVAMDKRGVWRATKEGLNGHRGYHLSSLYCQHNQTTFGKLARKFLVAHESVDPAEMRDFINSDLAEPYEAQEHRNERTETILRSEDLDLNNCRKILTIDCQQTWPYFWYVVRAWGETECAPIEAGALDQWDEIEKLQALHSIPNHMVVVDSGYGANEDAEVYRNCAEHPISDASLNLENQRRLALKLPLIIVGWLPAKGLPTAKRWRNSAGHVLPYRKTLTDPFRGKDLAGQYEIEIFEFAGGFFKDILTNLRRGKGDYKWGGFQKVEDGEINLGPETTNATYWKHMDAEYKDSKTGNWKKKTRYWPNHIFDCEVMQLAFADSLGIFKVKK